MDKKCIACGTCLTLDNWYKNNREKRYYKCIPCVRTKAKTTDKYKNSRTTSTVKKIYDKKLSLKISNFMQDAKRRKKDLEFSYTEIGKIMAQACFYCGENESLNGLDRVDSSKGYLKTNIVPCCAICNRAKNTLTINDFINHCEKVISHTRRTP